jgi:hypothetical protein
MKKLMRALNGRPMYIGLIEPEGFKECINVLKKHFSIAY